MTKTRRLTVHEIIEGIAEQDRLEVVERLLESIPSKEHRDLLANGSTTEEMLLWCIEQGASDNDLIDKLSDQAILEIWDRFGDKLPQEIKDEIVYKAADKMTGSDLHEAANVTALDELFEILLDQGDNLEKALAKAREGNGKIDAKADIERALRVFSNDHTTCKADRDDIEKMILEAGFFKSNPRIEKGLTACYDQYIEDKGAFEPANKPASKTRGKRAKGIVALKVSGRKKRQKCPICKGPLPPSPYKINIPNVEFILGIVDQRLANGSFCSFACAQQAIQDWGNK